MAETVTASGYTITGFIDESGETHELLGYPVVNNFPNDHIRNGGLVAIGIGDNYQREVIWNRLLLTIPIEQFPCFIHPSASISRFATIDQGTVVLQNAVVGSNARIGQGCLINSAAVVEHDCMLENFASIAPNATLGGNVHIGARTAISIGATVKHGISIGKDTVIGAQSYVHQDIPELTVAFGIPASKNSARKPGDDYLV